MSYGIRYSCMIYVIGVNPWNAYFPTFCTLQILGRFIIVSSFITTLMDVNRGLSTFVFGILEYVIIRNGSLEKVDI